MFFASQHGFLPENTAADNRAAMQRMLDVGGTIVVDRPGIYELDDTLYIGSNTTLIFENGAAVRKIHRDGRNLHVLLNRGALTKTWDEHITVRGMKIQVNDVRGILPIPGMRGQIALHYARDITLDDIRIPDLESLSFGIHICTFSDLRIHNCIITGKKDGIHLGRGKRFAISDCVFDTFDDAIALNGHDYDTSNPELGWIEDGVIERCYDVNADNAVGYFCRMLAGAWVDWYPGMQVQKSDTVVSCGRMYRVFAEPDGVSYTSRTCPDFDSGTRVLDGITWKMVQTDVTYNAGVRRVTLRDITLEKPRTAVSVHFDQDRWSRSFYPGAAIPHQKELHLENVHVLHESDRAFLSVATPIDTITVENCSIGNHAIQFSDPTHSPEHTETTLTLRDCSADGDVRGNIFNFADNRTVHLMIDNGKTDL